LPFQNLTGDAAASPGLTQILVLVLAVAGPPE